MASTIGLYLGSTTATLGVCKDGKAYVLANEAGERVTPAVVAFTNTDQVVGQPAKQRAFRNASNTIFSIRRVLGKLWEDPDVQQDANNSLVEMVNCKGCVGFKVEFKEKSTVIPANKVATLIFEDMLSIADSHGTGGQSHESVLAVPLYFKKVQKDAIRLAAEEAGFNILRIISEPSAAMMAYDIGQANPSDSCNVLVFKMGGTSVDISIVAVIYGMYKVLATSHRSDLGGKHLDENLMKQFAQDFKRQFKVDCLGNEKSRQKLRNAAEHCKHIVSNLTEAQSYIESLFEGIDYQCKLTRGRFEALCAGFLESCLDPISSVLQEAELSPDDISKVVVCGGSTKIPLLQSKLQSRFPTADFLCSLPADEVIAVGAAKQAAILSSYNLEELQYAEKATHLPCVPLPISIQAASGSVVVVPKHAAVPLRKQLKLNLQPNQSSAMVGILIGDHLAGQILMEECEGEAQLTVTLHVRSDGSLHVTCTSSSSKSKDLVIPSASPVISPD